MGSARKASVEGNLHVLIVGGSIAGLTLAHCLHHLKISYTVLEAHSELAPNAGASIVLMSNGARILDQLGLYDSIRSISETMVTTKTWAADGKSIIATNGPTLIHKRHGYPLSGLKRRDLLAGLAEHLPEPERVKTSKRVVRIEHFADGVVAYCKDGSMYRGDIIVGADGIHSTVRAAMQEHIETLHPGKTKKDREGISAEFNCIFGLGEPLARAVTLGDSHRTYDEGRSTLSVIGDGGKLYWFMFSKLDRRYFGDEIPRYSKADAEETAKEFFKLSFDGVSTFEDVWATKTMFEMAAVEEGQFENWTEGRFVCLGDAIHKMTPNFGAGGNAAIESAVALANALAVLPRDSPPLDAIRATLQHFFEHRHRRVNRVCDIANKLTRREALSTPTTRLLVNYLLPHAGDLITNSTCSVIVGAELLDCLPPPARSLTATMPWDKNSGVGKREKKRWRALWALPLLAMVYGCHLTMGVAIMRLSMTRGGGRMTLGNGIETGLWTRYFGQKTVDRFIELYVAFFTPAIGGFDPVGRLQMIAFLADIVPVQVIWLVEANRRGNVLTIASLMPTIIAQVYQIRGIGFLAPIYYYLHYIQSPLGNYSAADQRMVKIRPAKIIILTVFISYIVPTVAMFALPDLATRQWVNGLFFQPFPLWAALAQLILSQFVEDTTDTAKIFKPEADMPYLRQAYSFAAISSACVYFYVYGSAWKSSISLLDVFFKDISKPSTMAPVFDGAAKVLRYDHLWSFSAGLLWTLLSFSDLKKAGKVKASWIRVLGTVITSTLVAGPGTAMAVMWWWREEALAAHTRTEVLKEE